CMRYCWAMPATRIGAVETVRKMWGEVGLRAFGGARRRADGADPAVASARSSARVARPSILVAAGGASPFVSHTGHEHSCGLQPARAFPQASKPGRHTFRRWKLQ